MEEYRARIVTKNDASKARQEVGFYTDVSNADSELAFNKKSSATTTHRKALRTRNPDQQMSSITVSCNHNVATLLSTLQ